MLNPAKAGTSISPTLSTVGEYQVQFLNPQSIMFHSQKIAIVIDGEKALFILPASIAQGEYFITATSQQARNHITSN